MILEQHPFLVLWITSLLNPAEPKVTLHKAASKMYVSISLLFSTDLWPNCYYWQRQHCCNGDDLLMMASLAMKMVVMKIINVIWWGGFKYFLVFFLDFPENFSVIFWIFTFLHTVGESHLSSGWIYIFFLMKAWNIETILTTRCKVGQWAQYLAKSWCLLHRSESLLTVSLHSIPFQLQVDLREGVESQMFPMCCGLDSQ